MNIEEKFPAFRKMARLSRMCIITEKIDGTNGLIFVSEDAEIRAGSRNRWLTTKDDNYGFARWVEGNKEELLKLGVGYHYGEWWGKGINRNYGMKERVFSLFNTGRWVESEYFLKSGQEYAPSCCRVVPILYEGIFSTSVAGELIDHLSVFGSYAAKGFMDPEGICIYHTAADFYFKKTILKDEEPKGMRTQHG